MGVKSYRELLYPFLQILLKVKQENSNKEFKQFLKIALGSLAEIDTQLEISTSLGFISNEQTLILQEKISEIRRMIYGLIKNLPTN